MVVLDWVLYMDPRSPQREGPEDTNGEGHCHIGRALLFFPLCPTLGSEMLLLSWMDEERWV